MTTDAFISTADLATFMHVDEATLNPALASLAVAAAQQRVRNFLNQQITLVTDDVVLIDGNGSRQIRLPERPVRSITQIKENGNVLDPSEYTLRRSLVIRVGGQIEIWTWPTELMFDVWRVGVGNIEVTYTHGWDVGEIDSDGSDSDYEPLHVPADILLVALKAAKRGYESMGEDAEEWVDKQETIGAYSHTLSDAVLAAAGVSLLPGEETVLGDYKIKGYA